MNPAMYRSRHSGLPRGTGESSRLGALSPDETGDAEMSVGGRGLLADWISSSEPAAKPAATECLPVREEEIGAVVTSLVPSPQSAAVRLRRGGSRQ